MHEARTAAETTWERREAFDALVAVFDEASALHFRATWALGRLHGQGAHTSGMRAILRDLDRLGPQTVPQMARRRPVSRQHIQGLVNQLLDVGHVELIDNPAHRRSPLVRLTREGSAAFAAMREREAALIARLAPDAPDLTADDLRTAATVLRALREVLEGSRLRHLPVAGEGGPA